jgi:SAM-dependent methyltransferase
MTYDAAAITSYFDRLGRAEWDRFDRSLGDRVSLAMHTEILERFAPGGGRVLDVGAGPGRFTEQLHRLGCRIVVADISQTQLTLNRETASERGFASSIEGWHQLDICNLGSFASESFDGVVAYGGPFSYVFEHRDRALVECLRVLRPGGVLILSVMSLWGTLHRHLRPALSLGADSNRSIVETGDLTPESDPTTAHYCHMYRAAELRAFIARGGMETMWMSAASALTTGKELEVAADEASWNLVLELERTACVQPGYLDAGTHIIAVAKRAE